MFKHTQTHWLVTNLCLSNRFNLVNQMEQVFLPNAKLVFIYSPFTFCNQKPKMLCRIGRRLPVLASNCIYPIHGRSLHRTGVKWEPEKNKLDELFPRVEDFPAHHIGPRRHEAKAMLQILGYNVPLFLEFTYTNCAIEFSFCCRI